MRILQIGTEFGVGGIARHIIDLTYWLRDAGHSVRFVGGPDALLDSSKDEHFFAVPLAKVSGTGGSLWARIFNLLRCVWILRQHIKKNPADLIHCHESAPAIVAKLATLGMSIPIAVTYHGSEPERVKTFGRVGRFAADIVITPSHRCADELHEIGGIPRDRLRVVGLGVKPTPEVNEQELSKLRAELLGKDGKLLVVMLARASYQKGLDILIEVVEEIIKTRTDIRFVVAGIGPLFDAIKTLAHERDVDRYVNFIGETHQPYMYLRAADIFLLTSRWEALPISIVEAFRVGVPVIASNTGGVCELVDADVGALVPVGDVHECARQLLRIASDKKLRAAMSAVATERSQEDRFTPDIVHGQFEKLYIEMTT